MQGGTERNAKDPKTWPGYIFAGGAAFAVFGVIGAAGLVLVLLVIAERGCGLRSREAFGCLAVIFFLAADFFLATLSLRVKNGVVTALLVKHGAGGGFLGRAFGRLLGPLGF